MWKELRDAQVQLWFSGALLKTVNPSWWREYTFLNLKDHKLQYKMASALFDFVEILEVHMMPPECLTGNGKLAALASMAHSAHYSFSCKHPAAASDRTSWSHLVY